MPPINEWMGLGGGIYDGDKTMDYELNQILAYQFRSMEIAIGAQIAYSDSPIEIFDPELALIGKLDKIPIMRSLQILLQAVPDLDISMAGDTGNDAAKWLLQLFNDSQYNNPENPSSTESGWNGKKPNLIGMASRHVYHNITVGDVMFQVETINFSQQYVGGIPLKPKLLFRNELGLAAVVAGAAIPIGGIGHGVIFIEIDWTPVNKKEFDEYIREYIYTQEA